MNKKLLTFLVAVLAIALAVAGLSGFAAQVQADDGDNRGFGNHNLKGTYEFHADGVLEVDGLPTRGMWEVGRFEADGKGNMTNGVEYSSLLSSHDESIIDVPFTFSGTYHINPDGTGKSKVSVYVPAADITIEKTLWFVVHSVDKNGIAHGFAGGHADADLGDGMHGNARTHVGWRMDSSKKND
jgi:hypothetical protein